jgi:spore coat protein H
MRISLLLTTLLLGACDSDAISECDVLLYAEGWTAQTHLKGVDGDYDLLFGDETVHRIDVTICPGDYDNMQDDLADLYGDADAGGPPPGGGGPGGEEGGDPSLEGVPEDSAVDPMYVPVTVAFDGQSWPAVGMRYKGNSSLMQAYQEGITKLPFRLNFDYYDDVYPTLDDQRFHGFEELKFSSGFGDDSLVRDKVSADLFRAAGVPAARGSLVEIHVDVGDGPVYWGVYTMFEDPCGELLDSWFGDDDGDCYKADGTGATLASFDAGSFENKTDDDSSALQVEALVDALNGASSSTEDWREGLEAQLDVEGFLRSMAVSNLIGGWDGYGNMTHNYYLYADPSQGGRLVWVPWDFNLTFDASHIGEPLSVTMDEVGSDWPLIRLLMDDPIYAERYYELLGELVEGPLSAQAQEERFEVAHTLVAASAAAESGSFTTISQSFDGALVSNSDAVFEWIDASADEAAEAL